MDFFKILLSLSVSGTILILFLFLMKPFIKNKMSKKWQYYIWLIVVARLLIPFAAVFPELDSKLQKQYVKKAFNDDRMDVFAVVSDNLDKEEIKTYN
jgi:beta-lactamase regulating signal transducer with metallopeptidase domain